MYLYHQLTAADLLAAQDVLNETTAVVKIVSDFRNRFICSVQFLLISFSRLKTNFLIENKEKKFKISPGIANSWMKDWIMLLL